MTEIFNKSQSSADGLFWNIPRVFPTCQSILPISAASQPCTTKYCIELHKTHHTKSPFRRYYQLWSSSDKWWSNKVIYWYVLLGLVNKLYGSGPFVFQNACVRADFCFLFFITFFIGFTGPEGNRNRHVKVLILFSEGKAYSFLIIPVTW